MTHLLPKVSSFVWSFLPGGTPQFWARSQFDGYSQIYTKGRISGAADADWTDWVALDSSIDFTPISAALSAPSGLLLFALKDSETGVVYNTAFLQALPGFTPEPATFTPIVPLFPNPASPQNPNPALFAAFTAAVAGGPTNPILPVLYWVTDSTGGLWKAQVSPQGQADFDWTPFPPPERPSGALVKAARIFCINADSSKPNPSAASPTWPVWLIDEGGTLWWIQASFERSPNGTLLGPIWSYWSEFPVQLVAGKMVVSLAASRLEDGRIQIFAADASGALWSIWQIEGQNGTWRDGWILMPPPGAAVTVATPLLGEVTTALGQLPEGNLQLFIVGSDQNIYTMWKKGTDPDAGWSAWQTF